MAINYNRKSILGGILVAYFLLFFFSYFFFFITDNAISGKVIAEEKQVNITLPAINLNTEFSFDTQKAIRFFVLFGVILIAIFFIFYLSKKAHKKITKHEEKNLGYKPFKKIS